MIEGIRLGLQLAHSALLMFYGAKDHVTRKVSFNDGLGVLLLSLAIGTVLNNYIILLLLGVNFLLVKLMLISGIKPSISDQYMIYSSSYSLPSFLAGLGSVLIAFIVKKMNPNDKPPMWTFYAILHSLSLVISFAIWGKI